MDVKPISKTSDVSNTPPPEQRLAAKEGSVKNAPPQQTTERSQPENCQAVKSSELQPPHKQAMTDTQRKGLESPKLTDSK